MKRLFVLAVLILAVVLVSGCIEEGETVTEAEKRAVYKYAGPVVDRMMQGFNDENYTRFSADFGGMLKQAMTEERFKELREDTVQKYGLFVSRRNVTLEKEQGLYRITYVSDWELADGVSLTVTFTVDDPHHRIQTFRFG